MYKEHNIGQFKIIICYSRINSWNIKSVILQEGQIKINFVMVIIFKFYIHSLNFMFRVSTYLPILYHLMVLLNFVITHFSVLLYKQMYNWILFIDV